MHVNLILINKTLTWISCFAPTLGFWVLAFFFNI